MINLDNKVKFNIENLKNIIQGNEQSINYEKKMHSIKQHSIDQLQSKNKIHFDKQNGKLYKLDKDNNKIYLKSKEDYGLMPNWCPVCQRIMGKKQLDAHYWKVHKRCMDCSIEFQHQMHIDGSWQEYQRNAILNNMIDICNDAVCFYEQMKDNVNKEYVVDGEGSQQNWSVDNPQNHKEMLQNIIENIIKYRQYIIDYKEGKIKDTSQIQEKVKQDNQNLKEYFTEDEKQN